MSHYFTILQSEILRRSSYQDWSVATQEWELTGARDEEDLTACVCTHPIKWVGILENEITGASVEVGSVCVENFLGLDAAVIYEVKALHEKRVIVKKLFHRVADRLYPWERAFHEDTGRCRPEPWIDSVREYLNLHVREIMSRRATCARPFPDETLDAVSLYTVIAQLQESFGMKRTRRGSYLLEQRRIEFDYIPDEVSAHIWVYARKAPAYVTGTVEAWLEIVLGTASATEFFLRFPFLPGEDYRLLTVEAHRAEKAAKAAEEARKQAAAEAKEARRQAEAAASHKQAEAEKAAREARRQAEEESARDRAAKIATAWLESSHEVTAARRQARERAKAAQEMLEENIKRDALRALFPPQVPTPLSRSTRDEQ